MTRLGPALGLALAVLVGAAPPSAGQPRYDPAFRFRVLRTPHFSIYFHQGEDALAQRLSVIAEQARDDLARRLATTAPTMTHVVLVDQTDAANGWSSPVPYDTIELTAAPPSPASFVGHHDDWLRLVFIHEYAHLLQLDRVGGIMRAIRWTLGRHPASFPNLFLPEWEIEGLATWAESAETGLGRLHAADVSATIDAVTRARGPLPVDQANGGLVAWPSGHTPYVFGGYFYQATAAATSPELIGALTEATARRVPYFGGGAFPHVFGRGVLDLWREAQRDRRAPAGEARTAARRLTRDGFTTSGPRLVGTSVYYTTSGPHAFPSIRAVSLDGGASHDVTTRFQGDTIASDGDWLYFDQIEFDGAVAQYSDLYARHLSSGRVVRLSRAGRLSDADVDRPATRLAAVRARDGRRELTVWGLTRDATGAPALSARAALVIDRPGCTFATPRWSPDGTRLVAVRQCIGALPALVLVDSATGVVSSLTSAPGSRELTPSWTPDGRTILFASDRSDRRFKLYRLDLDAGGTGAHAPLRQVVDLPGGALWPDVSADGRTVAFVSDGGSGYDVYTARLDKLARAPATEAPGDPHVLPNVRPSPPAGASAGAVTVAPAPYRAWATIWPRAWSPLLALDGQRVDAGAAVSGSDVLGYHAYSLSATWRVSGPSRTFAFPAGQPSWSVTYVYGRWRPAVMLAFSDSVDETVLRAGGGKIDVSSDERTREAFAAVIVPWRRVRVRQDVLAGIDASERRLPDSTGIGPTRRNALRAAWAVSTAQSYGYSISPEHGARAMFTIERVTPALGADGTATSATFDGRLYVPGAGRQHVVAVRGALGGGSGDAREQRQFSLGGASAPVSIAGFSRQSLSLLRGFGTDAFVGRAVAVANLDYRLPVLTVERGYRTWPVLVRTLHAAPFADAGAVGLSLGSLTRPVWSAGMELAARVTLGYTWELNLAGGVAWTHDDARHGAPGRAAVFVRTGYAF